MNDYMKKTARKGAQQNVAAPVQAKTNGVPNSALQDVFAGKRRADSSMMGHSQNLAPSIAAKMSRSFGMDLTGMQVYRSDAMVGSGMQGMAQGNKVVLSSDIDLNTTAGQAVLGHEISHIHAQSQGIGTGHSGLYENAALEYQADAEGLMAAQGKSIYSDGAMDMGLGMSYGLGMQGVENMTTLGGGMSMSAGAPMQAKKGDDQNGQLGQAMAAAAAPELTGEELDVINYAKKKQPKDRKQAYRWAYRFGQKQMREDTADIANMTEDEAKAHQAHKRKLLDHFVRNMQIPEDVQDDIDSDADSDAVHGIDKMIDEKYKGKYKYNSYERKIKFDNYRDKHFKGLFNDAKQKHTNDYYKDLARAALGGHDIDEYGNEEETGNMELRGNRSKHHEVFPVNPYAKIDDKVGNFMKQRWKEEGLRMILRKEAKKNGYLEEVPEEELEDYPDEE